MENINFVSFDYSLSSPAMCFSDGETFQVYNFTSEKKVMGFNDGKFSVYSYPYPQWGKSQQNRYFKLADGFVNVLHKVIPEGSTTHFAIEDYAFGAKGKVFHIAENTQMIKHMVWQDFGSKDEDMPMLPPSVVKKHFTGKGNAKKELMAEAFKEKYGFYMHERIASKVDGTSSDIVDAIAVNLSLQAICKGEIKLEEIFKTKATPSFGELKKLAPFKGSLKNKA